MNYLINFVNLLIGRLGNSIAPSSLSASTYFTATETFAEGLNTTDENPLLGTTTMSVASAVTGAAYEAYDQNKYALNTSQAYVQSLSKEELKHFIAELESFQFEEDVNNNPKILSKTLNQGRIKK